MNTKKGCQALGSVTLATSTAIVNGTDGKTTTQVDYIVTIQTFSTDCDTVTGTDGSEFAMHIFQVETPRNSGVTSFVPSSRDYYTTCFSTGITTKFGFSGLLFGEWTTTVYYIYTPPSKSPLFILIILLRFLNSVIKYLLWLLPLELLLVLTTK